MSQFEYYTEEGLNKLKEELHRLKTVDRSHVTKQIAEAREKGDLSENAEYDAAKEMQGLLEMKISNLESSLLNARVLSDDLIDTSKIMILSKVTLKNSVNNSEVVYILVAEKEANLKEGKISINSPVGKGLLGKKIGDIAEIKTPGGVLKFEVLKIERS